MNKRSKIVRIAVLALVNILCLGSLVGLFLAYNRNTKQRLMEQNISDITHLNKATVKITTFCLENAGSRLEAVAKHIELNHLEKEDIIRFLGQVTSEGDLLFQMVGRDASGFQINPGAIPLPVDYSHTNNGGMAALFSEAGAEENTGITTEFSDSVSGMKCFALYRTVPVAKQDESPEYQTLMLLIRRDEFYQMIAPDGSYKGMGVALVNARGEYIINSPSFRADNLFEYLRNCNNLTQDDVSALKKTMKEEKEGKFFYLNADGAECIFCYNRIQMYEWSAITCVPLCSFDDTSADYSYPVTAIAVMLLLLILDVVFLAGLNRELARSMENERIANRSKSEFLSRMSHDIRTPLNGIMGMTRLALEEENSNTIKEYLNNIEVSGDFLRGLVNDILDVSRMDKGKMQLYPEPYAYSDLCKYLRAIFVPLCASKGIEFSLAGNPEIPVLLMDKLRFNQICFNLLSNAVKYTPAGGHVSMRVENEAEGDDRVKVHLTVSDDGIGMSEEFQGHMFEAFSQEGREQLNSGTGLGLSIVLGLVRLMNGAIRVTSREGVGTTFCISLEARRCGPTAAQAEQEQPPEDFLCGKRILLAEDNRINAVIAEKTLSAKGAHVTVVPDGRQAVDSFAASEEGAYSYILMDINMPVMDGYAAARAIRETKRGDAASVAILAMTANAYGEDVKKAEEAGMNGHIAKPVNRKELLEALYRALTPCTK